MASATSVDLISVRTALPSARPSSRTASRVIAAVITGEGLALPGGGRLISAEVLAAGTEVIAIIGPEAVALHRERPAGSTRNVWPGRISEITALGSRLRVLVTSDQVPDLVAEIIPEAAAEYGLADGTPVWTSARRPRPLSSRSDPRARGRPRRRPCAGPPGVLPERSGAPRYGAQGRGVTPGGLSRSPSAAVRSRCPAAG